MAVAGAGLVIHSVSTPASISLTAQSGHQHGRGMTGREMTGRAGARWRQAFSTLDNRNDPAFNQLLGINNRGVIAGYFGSGAQGHPNKGYLLFLSRRHSRHFAAQRSAYVNENVPGSVQTQVTGLNDRGVTVGFWSGQNTASQMNANFGFYTLGGRFHTVAFPARPRKNSRPPVNQLLGVNDRNIAVGFWMDARGNDHGYVYNIARHRFHTVIMSGTGSVTATAIANTGAIAGFFAGPGGMTEAFMRGPGGRFSRLAYPGATMTQAFGINDSGEVVGSYLTGSGGHARSFGFTWTRRAGFRSVTDPMGGRGTTVINGVNDSGDLVGFFTGPGGRTHGLLRSHGHFMAPPAPPLRPAPMPSRTARPAVPTSPASPTAMPSMMPTMPPGTPPAPPASPPPASAPPASAPPAPNPSASPPGGPW